MPQESECGDVIRWFKDAVKSIIKNHYGDAIKVDFDNLAICIDDKCAQFKSYEGMLLGLVVIDFAISTLPDTGGNPSAKSLNITQKHEGHDKERNE